MHIIIDSVALFTVSLLYYRFLFFFPTWLTELILLRSWRWAPSYPMSARVPFISFALMLFVQCASFFYWLRSTNSALSFQATPTIGICFCLILVRVGGDVDRADSLPYNQDGTFSDRSLNRSNIHPLRPLALHTAKEEELSTISGTDKGTSSHSNIA